MTKDEITRALRICGNSRKCTECPLRGAEFCLHIMTTCATDLIEQQAAEIIQLKHSNAALWQANEALQNEKANGGVCDVHPGQ